MGDLQSCKRCISMAPRKQQVEMLDLLIALEKISNTLNTLVELSEAA